jgi:hypothetical protein
MNKKTVFGLVLCITFLLLFSSSFSVAHTFVKKENMVNEKDDAFYVNDQTLDAKSLLKNLFFGRLKNNEIQLNFFTSTITTNCNQVEKETEITFGMFNDIDVDDNANTGVNGKDIRVQYLILPYFLPSPEFTIGAVFSVSVERIGEEIKDSEFSLSAMIADNLVSVGYESPETFSNEIPKRIQLSSTIFIEPMAGSIGTSFHMNPSYDENQAGKQITLFASFDDTNVKRSYAFGFQPASETQITLRSTPNPNKWQYSINRDTPFDTILTAEMTKTVNDVTKQTKLTIDSLPEEISFSLALTPFSSDGGSIEYESSTMYDVKVLVETAQLGQCKYAVIENTPRKLSAEWIPSRENGFYHIDIDSDGTTVYVLNSLQSPTINLSIKELSSVDMTAFWNLTTPGYLQIRKNPSLHIDLDILFEDWEAQLDAEPTAEDIICTWNSNTSGYFSIDTNQQPLSNVDLLIKGPQNGVHLLGETLAADDFFLEWNVWPLSEFAINKSGSIDYFTLSIDIFINGQWYHLWPWI